MRIFRCLRWGWVFAQWIGWVSPTVAQSVEPGTPITFNQHIAPLIFRHCAPCHRPGQAGPFSLLTFDQVRKRGQQIVEVMTNQVMPPWPPAKSSVAFEGERRLAASEIQLMERWVAGGSLEGDKKQLPALPIWPPGWQLGEPDLVVRMPQAYLLGSAGKDVYRHFVIPIPSTVRRYVHAMELRPGSQSVHHAFLLFDVTRQSRRTDAEDAELGIPGMSPPQSAQSPPGQFVSWQPGKTVRRGAPDEIWTLEPNTDLVLQMHLQPTGKPEMIQAEVGFYFTNTPPTQFLGKLGLINYAIDLPAGVTNQVVQDSFELPRDVELLGLIPHSHYIGRSVRGLAVLPTGEPREFLNIPRWDFRWQGDYRFATPLALRKGTRLIMEWSFDNSTNNVFNPRNPPTRVVYGLNTTNEMAELWIRMRCKTREDQDALMGSIVAKDKRGSIDFNTWRIAQNPNDAMGHLRLGQVFLDDPKRQNDSLRHLKTALRINPKLDEAHYAMAMFLIARGQNRMAKTALETTIGLNPEHADAHGNLGLLLWKLGDAEGSERHLQTALTLNPQDELAREALTELRTIRTFRKLGK
jgi:hypothetical protein